MNRRVFKWRLKASVEVHEWTLSDSEFQIDGSSDRERTSGYVSSGSSNQQQRCMRQAQMSSRHRETCQVTQVRWHGRHKDLAGKDHHLVSDAMPHWRPVQWVQHMSGIILMSCLSLSDLTEPAWHAAAQHKTAKRFHRPSSLRRTLTALHLLPFTPQFKHVHHWAGVFLLEHWNNSWPDANGNTTGIFSVWLTSPLFYIRTDPNLDWGLLHHISTGPMHFLSPKPTASDFFPEKYYVENFPEIFWKISGNFPQWKNTCSLFSYLTVFIFTYIFWIYLTFNKLRWWLRLWSKRMFQEKCKFYVFIF